MERKTENKACFLSQKQNYLEFNPNKDLVYSLITTSSPYKITDFSSNISKFSSITDYLTNPLFKPKIIIAIFDLEILLPKYNNDKTLKWRLFYYSKLFLNFIDLINTVKTMKF